MILQIPLPRKLEVQLDGSEMKLIGPSGTTHFQGSYADYNLGLEFGHIILTPKNNQEDTNVRTFSDSRVIERLIESVM